MDLSPKGALPRVLIVDDHPNSADMLARVLARLDPPVDVITASSGEQALKLAAEQQVDILITDFMMPGMNGLELVEKLGSGHKPAYIILMTAYDTPGLAITARRLQIQDYLVKPVQPEKIRTLVSKAVADLQPAQVPPTPAGTRILVADDSPDHLRMLAARLEMTGYALITAADGEETLRLLRAEKPDLLLLDIHMPRKDGFEVLAEMRADPELAAIPVIVVTAVRIGPRDVRTGLNLGADDYVTKPFDWHELEARIQAKLRVKFNEDRLRRQARELNVIPEIGRGLIAARDLNQLAGVVLQHTVKAFGADGARIDVFYSADEVCSLRYRPESGRLSVCETSAQKARAWGANSVVLVGGAVVVIADASTDPRWQEDDSEKEVAAMTAPLISRGKILGTLALLRHQSGYFTDDQAQLFAAMCGLVAASVENHLLSNRLEMAADMLRPPLALALSSSETLGQFDGLPESAQAATAMIRSAVRDLQQIVQRL